MTDPNWPPTLPNNAGWTADSTLMTADGSYPGSQRGWTADGAILANNPGGIPYNGGGGYKLFAFAEYKPLFNEPWSMPKP